jgi:hypothetical protein
MTIRDDVRAGSCVRDSDVLDRDRPGIPNSASGRRLAVGVTHFANTITSDCILS